jgi:hypothetical protein
VGVHYIKYNYLCTVFLCKGENMQTKAGTIEVTDYVEHGDGSATLVVDTDPDATRLLVSVGLRRLLEMAVDKENDEYKFEDENERRSTEFTEEVRVD